MVVYSRLQLRRTLGQNHIRDTYVARISASWGYAPYSLNLIDNGVADLSLSGQNAYVGAWISLHYSGIGQSSDARIATFNVGSGAYISQDFGRYYGVTMVSGADYERHEALPGADKDRAIDEAVKMLRVRREVAIDGVAEQGAYPLPDGVEQVLDAYVLAPDRRRTRLRAFGVVATATGTEVRISPALGDSQQLALDAITTVTLGVLNDATVDIPDERLVLYKAEAVCWGLLARRAPRGTADEYRRLENAAAQQYNQLARNFKPPVDRPPRLDGGAW